jgi:catechol 2,3-dioxygenase-like lactoylglutathione lyase family enzyme
MLGQKNAAATIGVKDFAVARKFYTDTLGLKEGSMQGEEAITYKSGDSSVFVYKSNYAGTNEATAVTFETGDEIDHIVKTLKAKGVKFEHYKDMPGTTLKGDVHIAGDFKLAWLKDPDGNIIALAGN